MAKENLTALTRRTSHPQDTALPSVIKYCLSSEVKVLGEPQLTLISSRHRLTYEEAEGYLRTNRGQKLSTKWKKDLTWQLGMVFACYTKRLPLVMYLWKLDD